MPDEHTPRIYNVKFAQFKVKGETIVGIGPDGFGLTPTHESTIIGGLKGEVGFNIDPSTGAEATLTLKSTSDSNTFLHNLWEKTKIGEEPAFSVEIAIDPGHEAEFGFKKRGMRYAVIAKGPEFVTDEKESPDYEWNFVGYGYYEEV